MSAYNIEIKTSGSGDDTGRFSPANHGTHVSDNVTGTATASWATALAADTAAGASLMMVFYNAGSTAIGVSQLAAADPTRYHVVSPGTQRDIRFDPTLAIKVKTL